MRDIENPMIEQIERTGYPSDDYIHWEREEEREHLERGEAID